MLLISRKIHALQFHKNALSVEVKIKLVTGLIVPHLDYCCVVYHGLSDELNIRLQRLVNCGIRFIYDLRRDIHITPYRQRLSWLSVENSRFYFLSVTVYRVSRQRLLAALSVFHIPLH